MKPPINIELILTPLTGDNPSGIHLYYEPVYDEIKEARRFDEELDQGEWAHERKVADWHKVISLTSSILEDKSKDIQLAVWLMEACAYKYGFPGVEAGLQVITGILNTFWETLHPEIEEDDDLEWRENVLSVLNNKFLSTIKSIPITDPETSAGYSWFKWQESVTIGDDASVQGEIEKKKARDAAIADGKISVEMFNEAVAGTSKSFYVDIDTAISNCLTEFTALDETCDEKFGNQAPALSNFKTCLQDCQHIVSKLLKAKRDLEPDEESAPEKTDTPAPEVKPDQTQTTAAQTTVQQTVTQTPVVNGNFIPLPKADTTIIKYPDSNNLERAVWTEALKSLGTDGLNNALEKLQAASCSAHSVREKTRYRLLIAKLCLKAEKADLALPLITEVYQLMDGFKLTEWEPPSWIAEVIETYYQCISTLYGPENKEAMKAFDRLCTIDMTRALPAKQ
jgi:type VI secretion system protein ImpA